jgi:hypothetical protein
MVYGIDTMTPQPTLCLKLYKLYAYRFFLYHTLVNNVAFLSIYGISSPLSMPYADQLLRRPRTQGIQAIQATMKAGEAYWSGGGGSIRTTSYLL